MSKDPAAFTRDLSWVETLRAPMLAMAFMLSTSGCGDEQKVPVAPEVFVSGDFCVVTLEALCTRQIACDVPLVDEAPRVDTCVDGAMAACATELEGWSASVEASLSTFDPAALASCQRQLAEASCHELAAGARPASCGRVFRGTARVGEPCYTDVECLSGATCANAGVCPGTCGAIEPEQMPPFDCRLSPCPNGQYCEGAHCAPQLGQLAACRQADACAEPYFCGKDVGAPDLRCRLKHGAGQRCFARSECLDGLGCLGGAATDQVCGSPRAPGGPCLDSDECEAGLICLSDGRCQPARTAGEGCVASECAADLYCWDRGEAAPPVCRPNSVVGIEIGAPCHPDFDRCGLGLYCRSDAGQDFGTCTLLPGPGASCADFAHGLFERCRRGACAPVGDDLVCVEVRPIGEACRTPEECATGSCVEGACAATEALGCRP